MTLSGGREQAGHEDFMWSSCDVMSTSFDTKTLGRARFELLQLVFYSHFSRVCQSNTFVAAVATVNTQIRSGSTMSFFSIGTVNIGGQNPPTPQNDPLSLIHWIHTIEPFGRPSMVVQSDGKATERKRNEL